MITKVTMEISLQLTGDNVAVLTELRTLLEVLEGISAANLTACNDPSSMSVADWPDYNKRLVRYNGSETTITVVFDKVFRPLWEARGEVVSIDELSRSFVDSVDPRQRVAETIHRLRSILKRDIPQIIIATAGDGYYLGLEDRG